MEREDFYKAINWIVREYAAWEYLEEKEIPTEDIVRILKEGAYLMMSLPLQDRLTPEEKEKIIKEYEYYKNSWNETELTETTMESFESIFGKDFLSRN